jgi:hypothetical protein
MELDITNKNYAEAIKLHHDILANGELAAVSLIEMCKNLKKMRDEKLFSAFGYETFDEYCEEMAKIKSRQAYTYISTYEKLGSAFLQSNANIGITKLELISQLPPSDRIDLTKDGNVEEMSVSEIRELVKKSKTQGEQISFMEDQLEELKKTTSENADISEKEKEIEALKLELEKTKSALQIAEEIAESDEPDHSSIPDAKLLEIRNEIEKEVKSAEKQKTKEAIDKAVEKATKKAADEAEQKAKESAEKAKIEAKAEYEKQIENLKTAQTTADSRAKELEKQLKLSDTKSATAMVYFTAMRDDYNKMMQIIDEMETEDKEKFKTAIKKALGMFLSNLETENG